MHTITEAPQKLEVRFTSRLSAASFVLYGMYLLLLLVWLFTAFIPLALFIPFLLMGALVFVYARSYEEHLSVTDGELALLGGVRGRIGWSRRVLASDVALVSVEPEPQLNLVWGNRAFWGPAARTICIRARSGVEWTGLGLTDEEAHNVASIIRLHLARARASG